jgi:hypothetical protein
MRSHGAGNQNVNKVNAAACIKHLPSAPAPPLLMVEMSSTYMKYTQHTALISLRHCPLQCHVDSSKCRLTFIFGNERTKSDQTITLHDQILLLLLLLLLFFFPQRQIFKESIKRRQIVEQEVKELEQRV